MSVLLPLSSCPSSLLILSFFLCPLVLPPLSFPSSSVLWSSSQFPLVVLVLFLLPPILFFCGIPDSYRGCCRIPTGFLQAFVYRVPTGFLWVPIGFLHNSYRVPMWRLTCPRWRRGGAPASGRSWARTLERGPSHTAPPPRPHLAWCHNRDVPR